MKRLLILALLLSACADSGPFTADMSPPPDMPRPMPRPGAGQAVAPAAGATTVDQFDTTTAAERAAAQARPAAAAQVKLGRTVASLGNPADPGFWLETPLAKGIGPGRVVSVATGAGVAVELRPIDGPEGAGSRISLPALRLLGVGLTGLHELDVFAGG